MTMDFIKNSGDGAGVVNADTYALSAGVFTKTNPDVKDNAEGDVAQAVSVYNLKFMNDVRTIS